MAQQDGYTKDDDNKFGSVTYLVFLVLFLLLGALGIYNVVVGHRVGRLISKSIRIFYVASITLIAFRVVLFTDPLLVILNGYGYPLGFYQICLETMPIFIYIIMGLSLVTCNVELVTKFRIAEIENAGNRTAEEKESKIRRNEQFLKWI
jgi:hypothetical protein